MQFSESWLREFINPDCDSQTLAQTLTMGGLEVESLKTVAPAFSGVVVAQVKTVNPHPNADRLRICEVDVGKTDLLQIVCGAPNVAPGIKVPCATVGAILPAKSPDTEGFKIRLSSLRGIESQGMLCAAAELGLSIEDNASGLIILSNDAPVGGDIRQYLKLDDSVFEIKLTPNKADCLSLFGVAREVSALMDIPLVVAQQDGQPLIEPCPVVLNEKLPVNIEAADLCGRFAGRILRGVHAQTASPDWLKNRLASAGQKSISVLVDISNYVMLEYGLPNHIFDLDRLQGPLSVRWAKPGEKLSLLNDQIIDLDDQTGIIADAQGPISLAGIMGGKRGSVSLETINLFIEVAFWYPDSIRGRSKQYRINTEAGHRFERGVDYGSTLSILERITQLIQSICGGEASPINDQTTSLPTRPAVALRQSRAEKIIGTALTGHEIKNILQRLNFSIRHLSSEINTVANKASTVGLAHTPTKSPEILASNNLFHATPPSYRFDIESEIDLIEEIVRVKGYDSIPARMPLATTNFMLPSTRKRSIHYFRHNLAALGYNETLNFSFVDGELEKKLSPARELICLINPIASQLTTMRTTLLCSLLSVLRYNLNRHMERVRAFEIGRVFYYDQTINESSDQVAGIAQPVCLGGLAYGTVDAEQWGKTSCLIDFFDIKGDVENVLASYSPEFISVKEASEYSAFHPGRLAEIKVNHQLVGLIGELHPRLSQQQQFTKAPIYFEINLDKLPELSLPIVQAIAKFPPVRRDMALVVDIKLAAQTILNTLFKAARQPSVKNLVNDIKIFDQYFLPETFNDKHETTSAKKSLAFAIILQDTHATLREETIEEVMNILLEAAQTQHGAELRQ